MMNVSCPNNDTYMMNVSCPNNDTQGRIQGGAHPAPPPPLKLEKILFFGVKS